MRYKFSVLIVTLFLFMSCAEDVKTKEKIVDINHAKEDGFEIIAFKEDELISLKYKEYDSQNKKHLTYIIKNNEIKNIEDILKNKNDARNLFVKLYVKNFDKFTQKICLEYHYPKSTYKYCYDVIEDKVIPRYSEYHDLYKNEKVIYK